MDSEPKKYELAYLISSSIADEEVSGWKEKLTKAIEDSKGIVRHAEEPKKRKLSFLINKEVVAYFGWIDFLILPELTKDLEKKLKGFDKLLRYLLVIDEDFQARPQFRTFSPRSAPSSRPPVTPPAGEVKGEEEKLDLEELDKKLEEILGK